MKIHLGSRVKLMTKCGKPVGRRWWVDQDHRDQLRHSGKYVTPVRREVNCIDCLIRAGT